MNREMLENIMMTGTEKNKMITKHGLEKWYDMMFSKVGYMLVKPNKNDKDCKCFNDHLNALDEALNDKLSVTKNEDCRTDLEIMIYNTQHLIKVLSGIKTNWAQIISEQPAQNIPLQSQTGIRISPQMGGKKRVAKKGSKKRSISKQLDINSDHDWDM